MKTIKNSIIGGFAVFGFLCLFTAQVYPTEITDNMRNKEEKVTAANNPKNMQGRFQISTEYDPTGKVLMEVVFDTKMARVIQRRRIKVYDWSIQAPSYKNINGNITIR